MGQLEFQIDGFRSLRKTSFTLKSGINIFVGPNGSGKTNIAACLEFISIFLRSGAEAAVSKMGGASRVFSAEEFTNNKAKHAHLSISISGAAKFTPSNHFGSGFLQKPKRSEKRKFINFRYDLVISLDKKNFSLKVIKENIEWKILDKGNQVISDRYIKIDGIKKENCCTNYELSVKAIEEDTAFMDAAYRSSIIESYTAIFESITQEAHKQAKVGRSFFNWASPVIIPELRNVASVLSFGRSFNINPEKVRGPEDIASKYELNSDGTGTISQLYSIKPPASVLNRKRKSNKEAISTKYEKVIENFCQLNEEISELEITPVLQTGKIECRSTIGRGQSKFKLPISSLSDGTAKWLAILTVIRCVNLSYCIEEPENYLHPKAQRIFIDILRGLNEVDADRYFLITTHSETVVNSASVDELRICDFERGVTSVRSIERGEQVESAINETGFGLGYFYSNGHL